MPAVRKALSSGGGATQPLLSQTRLPRWFHFEVDTCPPATSMRASTAKWGYHMATSFSHYKTCFQIETATKRWKAPYHISNPSSLQLFFFFFFYFVMIHVSFPGPIKFAPLYMFPKSLWLSCSKDFYNACEKYFVAHYLFENTYLRKKGQIKIGIMWSSSGSEEVKQHVTPTMKK